MSRIKLKAVTSKTADANDRASVGYLMWRCADSWRSSAVLTLIVMAEEMHGVLEVAVDAEEALEYIRNVFG